MTESIDNVANAFEYPLVGQHTSLYKITARCKTSSIKVLATITQNDIINKVLISGMGWR